MVEKPTSDQPEQDIFDYSMVLTMLWQTIFSAFNIKTKHLEPTSRATSNPLNGREALSTTPSTGSRNQRFATGQTTSPTLRTAGSRAHLSAAQPRKPREGLPRGGQTAADNPWWSSVKQQRRQAAPVAPTTPLHDEAEVHPRRGSTLLHSAHVGHRLKLQTDLYLTFLGI